MQNNLNKEEIVFIHEPQKKFKFLPANRLTKDPHVRSLMGAFLRREWIPPIYVTKDGYVVDGQNRYKAFCNICEKYPSKDFFLRVLIINSDEDPIVLAIRLNANQKRWLADDYFRAYTVREIPAYLKLTEFMAGHKELKGVRSALQIIKGSYLTKVFQNGSLQITDTELKEAELRMHYLNVIYNIVKDSRVYSRDIIVAFYNVFKEVKDWSKFCKNLQSKFKAPSTQKCTDWTTAYRVCL